MRPFRFLLLVLLMAASSVWAQTYPEKTRPLRILVTSGVGDGIDMLARAVGQAITEQTGWSVVVENKPGADMVIGVMAAKAAAPDGYTLMMTSSSSMVLNAHMLASLPYDPVADFLPVAGIAKGYLTVNIPSALPFTTARDFVAAARTNPGKYTIGGSSTTTRLAGEMLQQMADIKLLAVPYKSAAEAGAGLAAGQVDMYMTDVPTAAPFIKSGRVRMLAVTGTSRLSSFPETPTLVEEGVKGYDLTAWYATYLPAHTPPAIATTLREIVRNARKSLVVTKVIAQFAMEPLELVGDQMTALQRADSERWGKVARAGNMRPN